MKAIIAGLGFVFALTASASADTFSFVTTAKQTASVAAMGPGGAPVFGSMSTFENKITDDKGKVTESKGNCSVSSAPPGSEVAVRGVCNSTSAEGNSNVLFVCSPVNPKTKTSNCWGWLIGTSGTYANRTGTATWSSKASEDGKTTTGTGAGVWN